MMKPSNMVEKWWFHSFGESVRENVETWSTKWMKASKVLEKIVLQASNSAKTNGLTWFNYQT